MADRTLVVKLVGDEADLLRSYTRAERATKTFGRTTDTQLARADKRLRSFKAAGAGFAGGFIASEVIGNLTTFIDKAAESERVLTQVQQGLRNTGQTWERYGDQIESTVRAQSQLGFDDEDLLQSFDRFNRTTKNVTRSLQLNNLAMDVARGRNIDLSAAATLVTKAATGQRGSLTRLGIQVDKNADSVELLRVLTEKYGGSAKAAANDAATAQARLGVQLENVQESIGTVLLPAVIQLADGLEDGVEAGGKLVGVLRGLGKVKIPVIDIPLNFELPGSDKKLTDLLFKTNIFEVAGFAKEQLLQTEKNDKLVTGLMNRVAAEKVRDRPIVVQTEVRLDGEAIGRSSKKVAQKDRARNGRQKRGPNSALR